MADKIYYNQKQIEAMCIGAKNEYIVASRGFGKSEGIDAPRLLRNVFAMPGSTGALLSPTYGKLLTNTLPAIANALERHGYYRNIHYFIGKKPLKNLGFKKPLTNPFSYEHIIIWFNGSTQVMVSFDRPMSVNSMSLDYIMGFESKYLNYEKIKNEVLPANRGNNKIFGKCPYHHGQLYTTDMPTSSQGSWILEKKNEMDPKLINLILNTYVHYQRYNALNDANSKQKARALKRDLDYLRSKATFYAEYNVFDNLEILGEEFVRNMKRDLPDIVFNTSILNRRIKKVANGFYSAFDENIHTYQHRYNDNYLESLNYDLGKSVISNCNVDSDLLDDQPLEIAADYNAAINNIVVGQLDGNNQRVVHRFYVKTPKKLRDVAQMFADYYQPRTNRDVIYYYDSTAVYESATSETTFAAEVMDVLSRAGYKVTPVYLGQPEKHRVKHLQMDNALKGDTRYLFPLFNAEHCEDLILSIQMTGIIIGRNGFEKDKSLEKKPDTTESPDQLKTHGTDAFDTLFQGMNFNRPTISSIPMSTTFMDG